MELSVKDTFLHMIMAYPFDKHFLLVLQQVQVSLEPKVKLCFLFQFGVFFWHSVRSSLLKQPFSFKMHMVAKSDHFFSQGAPEMVHSQYKIRQPLSCTVLSQKDVQENQDKVRTHVPQILRGVICTGTRGKKEQVGEKKKRHKIPTTCINLLPKACRKLLRKLQDKQHHYYQFSHLSVPKCILSHFPLIPQLSGLP